MKAAVITGVGESELPVVDDPRPGPREVIVDVAACGICGTDLHILQGEFAPTLPIITGRGVAGDRLGDRDRIRLLDEAGRGCGGIVKIPAVPT